jgi:hypothetical protein
MPNEKGMLSHRNPLTSRIFRALGRLVILPMLTIL